MPGSGLDIGASVDAPPPSPYVEVRFEADWVDPAASYVVLEPPLVYLPDVWTRLSTDGARALERAAAGIDPFSAPAVTSARLEGRALDDPAAYAALLGSLVEAPAPPSGARLLELELLSKHPSPWTQAGLPLRVVPDLGLVLRGGAWYRLPDEVAIALRSEVEPAAVAEREEPAPGSGGAALWVLSLIAVPVALGAVLIASRSARSAARLRSAHDGGA